MLLHSLLLASGLAEPHPISSYMLQLELSPEETLVTIDFTYDDVVMLESLSADDGGELSAESLRTALVDFQRRVETGTGLYDSQGTPLMPTSVTLSGETEPGALSMEKVGEVGCTLHLRYPALDEPASSSVLFDWGGWRKSISSIFYCAWSTADGEDGNVIWEERERFPLLPPKGAEEEEFGGLRYAFVTPLEERRTGFSYLYVEADHVRHEFVVPLTALAREITPGGVAPSLAALVADEERATVEGLLDLHLGSQAPLVINNAVASPSETHVRWFTRDSLRRGVAAEDRAISLATGFVGMMSVYPVSEPTRHLGLSSTSWLELLDDHVVSVILGERTERTVLAPGEPDLDWSGDPVIVPARKPTQVEFVEPARIQSLAWAALAALAMAALLFARWRRVALTLCAGSAGFAAAHLLMPRYELDPEQARPVLESLLENTYLACGRLDEREALELLSATSQGSLLEELYLDLRGQLSGPWPTGAGTVIEGVEMLDCELIAHEARHLSGLCRWSVDARIEHWGHVHNRSLEITGQLEAAAGEGRWRFEDVLLQGKRIASADSRPRQ